MKLDQRVIYNFVLKSAQIVVECDDVFLENNARSQSYPSLVAFDATFVDRKPFVQAFGRANERPYFVGVALDKNMTTNGAHWLTTLLIYECARRSPKSANEPPKGRGKLA